MSQVLAPDAASLVTYNITEQAIAETKTKYAGLSADTPAGYEEVRLAIAHVRDTRVSVEKRRVELKADALKYGRLVDSEAAKWTNLLSEIENPLKAKKQAVDDESARLKAEQDAAKLKVIADEIKANLARQEEERRAKHEAEQATLASERAALEADRAALAEERRQAEEVRAKAQAEADAARQKETERIDAERREAEAARAKVQAEDDDRRRKEDARLKAEREEIERQRREVEAERQKAERAEFERQAKAKAESDAIAKVERDRLEAAERTARIAALAPDVEKVHAFAETIRALVLPKPKSKEAKAIITTAATALEAVASGLAQWEAK